MDRFAEEIDAWGDTAIAMLTEVTQEATKELTKRLLMRSPVLTGEFVAGWRAVVNREPHVAFGPHGLDPTKKATQAKMNAVIETAPFGSIIHIVNDVEHGPRLEFGWTSDQAPHGIVRITARSWRPIVKRAVGRVNRRIGQRRRRALEAARG